MMETAHEEDIEYLGVAIIGKKECGQPPHKKL